MSKSRSKGYIYGTPICIKGGGGHVLSAYQILLGPIGGAQQRDDSRAAKRRRVQPARAAGCDIYATVYPQCNSREAAEDRARQAHNLCVYNVGNACDTMSHWHITFRWSRFVDREEIYIWLTIDLTIIMGYSIIINRKDDNETLN